MEADKCLRGTADKPHGHSLPVSLAGNTESQPISGAVAEQLCPTHGPKKLKLSKGEGLFTVGRYNSGEWLV